MSFWNPDYVRAEDLEQWCAVRAKVNVEFRRVVMHNVAKYKVDNNIYKRIIVYE